MHMKFRCSDIVLNIFGLKMESRSDRSKFHLLSGGSFLRLVRWAIKYFLFYVVCMVMVAIAMPNLPVGMEVLFAFVTPAFLVWWHEKRRETRIAEKDGLEAPRRVALTSEEEQLSQSKPYQPKQNYAELIGAGRQARADLEAAAEHRSAGKLARQGLSRALLDQQSQPERSHQSSPARSQGWVRKGQSVTVAGRTIDGMVYVGKPPRIGSSYSGESCRAYIDPSLTVARVGSDKNGDNMSYWPGYSSIPAVCRATYLDWLADGRQDGTVNPGYMFLFFYGLERRFLVDQPSDDEKREIVAEVERLKSLFSENYSVQRYLGEFLDIARIMAMGGISLDDATLKQAILENRSWDLFLDVLRALGQPEVALIEQASDGLLLLGAKGEKLVEHYSFYAVFQTPEEYRLISGGKELGTLPIDNMIAPGMLLIFSGRRWLVQEVLDRDRVIMVAPARAGVPPIFGGDPGNIHDRVIERMFDVLEGQKRPIYLDATALELLDEARGNYAQLRFDPGRIAQLGENAAVIATKTGSVRTTTLALALRANGFTVQTHDGFLEVFGKDESPQLIDALSALADGKELDLFAHSQNLLFEKFHPYLTEDLLQKDALSARLDANGLTDLCRSIKGNG